MSVRVWCLRHAESDNVTTGTAAVLTTPLKSCSIDPRDPVYPGGRHPACSLTQHCFPRTG